MYKSFKEMLEGKQVGLLYHFTKGINLRKIIQGTELSEPFELISRNGVISTTRNQFMSSEIFRNDFQIEKGYIVRITLDGNKISEKYNIKAVAGYTDYDPDIFNTSKNFKRIKRSSGEAEEVIKIPKINILPYIIEINILQYNDEAIELFNDIRDIMNKLNIKISLTRKFSLVEKYSDKNDTFYDIIIEE